MDVEFHDGDRRQDVDKKQDWYNMGTRLGQDWDKMGSRWGQDGVKMGTRWGQDCTRRGKVGVKEHDWDKEQDINGHKDKGHMGERMWTRRIHDGGKGQDEEMIRTRVKMGIRNKMGTRRLSQTDRDW